MAAQGEWDIDRLLLLDESPRKREKGGQSMDDVLKEHLNLAGCSEILNLTLPRYVPLVMKGTSLAVWHDIREDQLVVLCPECHELITCDTLGIVYREMVWSEPKCC